MGHSCNTAGELRRQGLRGGSYPFDWNISRMESVLAMIETDFHGFLELDHLQRDPERPHVVRDMASGVDFHNDFDRSLPIAEQYEVVRERYERRINRFRRATAQRTLFVRHMMDSEECAYLSENIADILAILRRSHPQNDLLILGGDDTLAACADCGSLEIRTVAVDESNPRVDKFVRKSPQLKRDLLFLNYSLVQRLRNILIYCVHRLRVHLRLRTRLRRVRSYL